MTKLQEQIKELEQFTNPTNYEFLKGNVIEIEAVGNMKEFVAKKALSIINQMKEDSDYDCKEYHLLRKGREKVIKKLEEENKDLRGGLEKIADHFHDVRPTISQQAKTLKRMARTYLNKNDK